MTDSIGQLERQLERIGELVNEQQHRELEVRSDMLDLIGQFAYALRGALAGLPMDGPRCLDLIGAAKRMGAL